MDANKLKKDGVIKILKDWASLEENWKYHFKWIDKLDTSSDENLFNDYRKNAPANCLEATEKRISYLLKD